MTDESGENMFFVYGEKTVLQLKFRANEQTPNVCPEEGKHAVEISYAFSCTISPEFPRQIFLRRNIFLTDGQKEMKNPTSDTIVMDLRLI